MRVSLLFEHLGNSGSALRGPQRKTQSTIWKPFRWTHQEWSMLSCENDDLGPLLLHQEHPLRWAHQNDTFAVMKSTIWGPCLLHQERTPQATCWRAHRNDHFAVMESMIWDHFCSIRRPFGGGRIGSTPWWRLHGGSGETTRAVLRKP